MGVAAGGRAGGGVGLDVGAGGRVGTGVAAGVRVPLTAVVPGVGVSAPGVDEPRVAVAPGVAALAVALGVEPGVRRTVGVGVGVSLSTFRGLVGVAGAAGAAEVCGAEGSTRGTSGTSVMAGALRSGPLGVAAGVDVGGGACSEADWTASSGTALPDGWLVAAARLVSASTRLARMVLPRPSK